MRRIGCAIVSGLTIASALSASAQAPALYNGEIVMDQAGALRSPWIEKRVCEKVDLCWTLIMNSKTLEVARANGRLTSPFEATGRGQEVQRAEPARDKAFRLKGLPVPRS